MRRARIGVDGNCGFAGIGHLAESQDWEFVEIVGDPKDREAQERAATAALVALRARLAPEQITYELDGSHPRAL